MKKLFTLFLTLFVASSVWAADFSVNGFSYNKIDTKTVSLVGVPNESDVSIPSNVYYSGTYYDVVAIGENAFKNKTNLISITIPNSITNIGAQAFNCCSSLTAITIPNSVTAIGYAAFSGCSSLTSITIPNSVTAFGYAAFNGCSNLTSITIPDGVESISYMFKGCSSLTSITIPNSVTSIDSHAFNGCSNLTSITIPNSVTVIGDYAFFGCSSLTSITIPNSVTRICKYAFQSCSNLTSITIPDGVTVIDESAFSNCSSLTSITLPESCRGLGSQAFRYCTNLTSVTIRSNRISFAPNVFNNCSKLTQFTSYASIVENYGFWYPEDDYPPCTLYVPCELADKYRNEYIYNNYHQVECIGSEMVELQENKVEVVPEKKEALFKMPTYDLADSYTLTIQKNGVTLCTLTFNAQGQLANIDFSTTKSYRLKSDVSAYQFTVTGLSEATNYGYSFKALNANKAVLKEYAGSFTTKNENGSGGSTQGGGEVEGSGQGGQGGSTAVSEVSNATAVSIVNGQILVNGEAPAFVVTVSGQKIANANLKAGVYFVLVDGETVGVSVR